MLATIEAKSTFVEEIKAKKFEYGNLENLRMKIANGKSQLTTRDEDGLLNHKGRICVP